MVLRRKQLVNDEMKLEEIKKHWDHVGSEFNEGAKVTPTSRDPYLAVLERENILDYLRNTRIALEMGCGDASHSIYYAKRLRHLFGIDIAASLIGIARARSFSESLQNVDFIIGSVLNMEAMLHSQKFDCIISQRCIINLPNWDHQKDVILQSYNLLRSNGLLLVTEGFQDELSNLNGIRKTLGLSEIKAVSYNRNLIRKEFEFFVDQYFDIVETRHYGVYLFLSRIFHPLAVFPENPKHDSKLNEAAMKMSRCVQIPNLEKYSYNLFYVLKKK